MNKGEVTPYSIISIAFAFILVFIWWIYGTMHNPNSPASKQDLIEIIRENPCALVLINKAIAVNPISLAEARKIAEKCTANEELLKINRVILEQQREAVNSFSVDD